MAESVVLETGSSRERKDLAVLADWGGGNWSFGATVGREESKSLSFINSIWLFGCCLVVVWLAAGKFRKVHSLPTSSRSILNFIINRREI